MGKSKFKGGRGGGRGGHGGGGPGGGGRSGGWRDNRSTKEVVRENKRFQDYYNNLGILDDDEQEAFWSSMRSDLPNSFRFTGSRGHALVVQKRLIDHYIPQITSVTYDGEKVPPPEAIPWYPSNLAWSMTTPKNVIRRFPPFAAFQKFLVSENGTGNITRQEIVSMIPPLFMDIKPGMSVLDLCAAPGSKSVQLIEMVHGGEEARMRRVLERIAKQEGKELGPAGAEIEAEQDLADGEADYEDDGRSTGILIANDKEYRRAQMLVHQTKRLNSPNIIVTNHDATAFPSLRIPSEGPAQKYLKFDRILADVPCSGDGTARKNIDVWKNWTASNALGLHATQVRILVRALQMLKVGGRVVFSTCSLNPIENESVVAEAIDRCGGTDHVVLVNTADMLPALKRREGLRTWTVTDRAGRIWNSWGEVEEAKAEQTDDSLERLAEGFFPPPPESEIPLHRCIRVYPHLQDTGGFFVAVLEKKREIKLRQENAPARPAAIKKEPTAEEAPISALISEVQNQTSAETKTLDKVDAADAVMNEAAVNGNGVETNGVKREFDGQDDEAGPVSKRVRTDDDNAPVSDDMQDRQVHWPPPPAAPANLHPTKSGEPAPQPNAQAAIDFAPGKKRQTGQPQEEAFKFMDPEHEELQAVEAFYALSPRFPRDRFMVRNASGIPAKAIYYTSAAVRDVLIANEGKGIKFVHAGIRMFVKQDVAHAGPDACKWRIQTEGLPLVEPWIGPGRAVSISRPRLLRRLLIEMFPRLAGASEPDVDSEGAPDPDFAALAAQVRDKPVGCCVLRVQPDGTADGFAERLVMPLWRGAGSVNLMLPKDDRRAMLLRLFDDETPLVDAHRERQAQAGRAHGGQNSKAAAADNDDARDAAPDDDDDMDGAAGAVPKGPSDDESDDEDGGVALPPQPKGLSGTTQEQAVPQNLEGIAADQAAEAADDARGLAAVKRAADDKVVDAPGGGEDGEADRMNKTV